MHYLHKITALFIFSCTMLLMSGVTAAQRVAVSELSTQFFFNQLSVSLESIGALYPIHNTVHLGTKPEAPDDDVFVTEYGDDPIFIFVICNSKHEIYSVTITTHLLNSPNIAETEYLADRLKYPILGVCSALAMTFGDMKRLNALRIYVPGKSVTTNIWCPLSRRRIYMRKSYYNDRYYVNLWATDKMNF